MGKPLDKLQVIESAPLSASEWFRESVSVYNESPPTDEPTIPTGQIKHRNSVHVALTFDRGATLEEITVAMDRFVNILSNKTEVQCRRFFIAGVMIEEQVRPLPGLPSQPACHAHLVIRSPKGRRTGRTVARIQEHHPAIMDGLSDSALHSFVMEPVYDLPGLLAYITGPKNLSNPSTTKSWIFQ